MPKFCEAVQGVW